VGKAIKHRMRELVAHLGGESEVSAPMKSLLEHCARLRVLQYLCWAELERGGAFRDGQVSPAIGAWLSAVKAEKDTLMAIGLERKQKVATLADYLREAGEDAAAEPVAVSE
jgi:hypothetical protein